MVDTAPPIKPSHVFFGDNLMSGVRPKKKPNMYAMMSLQIIIDTGNTFVLIRQTGELVSELRIISCFEHYKSSNALAGSLYMYKKLNRPRHMA